MPNQATRGRRSGPTGRSSRSQARRRVEMVTLAHVSRCGRPRRGKRGLHLLGAGALLVLLLAPILLSSGSLAGTVTLDPPPGSSYWERNAPQSGRDPQRTHYANVALATTPAEPVWSRTGFNPFLAGAVVDLHNAYVVDRKGNVTALNLTTGDTVWQVELKQAVSATPALGYGWLYVATEGRDLFALSARSGTELHKMTLAGAAKAAPLVTDGRIYQGTDAGILQVLDATTLEEVWRFDTATTVMNSNGTINATDTKLRQPIRATPAAFDGKVYVASWNRRVYSLSATGNIHGNPETWHWTKTVGDIVNAAPVVDRHEKQLLIATADGRLESFELTAGAHRWAVEAGGSFHRGVAVSDDLVVAATSNGRILGADPAKGTVLWQRIEESGVIAAPIITKDAVVTLTANGTLLLHHPNNGTLHERPDGQDSRWRLPSGAHATPAVTDRGMLVVDQSGAVTLYGPTGRPRVDLVAAAFRVPLEATDYLPLSLPLEVTNRGPSDAPDVLAVLEVNGTEAARANLGPLGVNATHTWTPTIPALGLGTWTLRVTFSAVGADEVSPGDETATTAAVFREDDLDVGAGGAADLDGEGTPDNETNKARAARHSFGDGFATAFSPWMVLVGLVAVSGGVAGTRLVRTGRIPLPWRRGG